MWAVIRALTGPKGLRVTPTCLQLAYARGKTVDYTFTDYTFDTKKRNYKGTTSFSLHVWQGKKRIKKIGMNQESDRPSDALKGYEAVCEMFVTHLLIAQENAMQAQGKSAGRA